MAKTIEPSGALKAPASPAAAPAATRVMRCHCARFEQARRCARRARRRSVRSPLRGRPSRPLPLCTPAAKRFGEGRHGAHAALAIIDGVDDVGDALAAPVGGQRPHQHDDGNAADGRRQDHQRPEPAGGRMQVRIVIEGKRAEEKEIVDRRDHGAEQHRWPPASTPISSATSDSPASATGRPSCPCSPSPAMPSRNPFALAGHERAAPSTGGPVRSHRYMVTRPGRPGATARSCE